MKGIGIVEENRLLEIPKRCHAKHEFCVHLYERMRRLLVQMEIQRAGHISFKLQSEEERQLLESGVHPLDFLNQSGRGDLERRAVINHICMALYADMLHFVYEGLRALERRKFSVAFSLFRKPFKEGMLLAARMCADEELFFNQLKSDAKNLLNRRISGEQETISVLTSALVKCRGSDFLSGEKIYEAVFDRKQDVGLAVLFDKATHLVTEFAQIETENYNLNFIFKDPRDNDVYEGSTYAQIAILLLFINLMLIEFYSRMGKSDLKYRNSMLFTSVGAFEALFTMGRPKMVKWANRIFGDFLECPICLSKMKIKKTDAPRFFIGETLDCNHCYSSHQFPVEWLLSRVETDLFAD